MTTVIKLKDLAVETLTEQDGGFYGNKSKSRIFLNTGYIEAPYGCNEDTILVKPKEKDLPKYAFFIPSLTEFKFEFNVRYKTDYTVFDQNGIKNQALMDNLYQPFTASFLLEPVRYNGRVDFWVKQIRVKTIKDLPDGFKIIS